MPAGEHSGRLRLPDGPPAPGRVRPRGLNGAARVLTRRARSRPAHHRDPRRGRAGHRRDRGPDGPRGRGRMSITRPPQPGTGELAQLVLDRTIALSGIPAPTGHEDQRAQVLADWWA